MDESERLVEKYLMSLGRGAVCFEPDGNVPPDFLLAGRIAIEVRRLNQNYVRPSGETEGLEELAIPLWQRLQKLFRSLGASVGGECWYVLVDYKRPIGSKKQIQEQLLSQLVAFKKSPNRSPCSVPIGTNFSVDLIRAGIDHGTFFLLGGSSDGDSGGFVMGEVERNMRLCIAEKEKKIRPFRGKYQEWWLVMPDYIDFSMDPEDREVFRTEVMPGIQHNFQKVVLLDPRGHRRAFEV